MWLQFEFTHGVEMVYIAWCGIDEVPYFVSRSSIKFQGHTARKTTDCDSNWAFQDCNSSLPSYILSFTSESVKVSSR